MYIILEDEEGAIEVLAILKEAMEIKIDGFEIKNKEMTQHEEKAKELAEKMYSHANRDMGMDWYEALACAKTAVDVILEQYNHISAHLSPDWCNKQIKFYQKVKESINKM